MGAGAGCPGRASPPLPFTGMLETARCTQPWRFRATPRPSSPACSARGLEDDRYVVERFQAMADGDIRRMPGEEAAKKKGRKVKRTIAKPNLLIHEAQQRLPRRNV